MVIAKPADGNAWLLLILLTFPSVLFNQNHGFATGIAALLLEFWFQTLVIYCASAAALGTYFPERSRLDAKRRG